MNMNSYLSSVNAGYFYGIVAVVLTFIMAMCLVFCVKSYRAGVAIGMEEKALKKVITSSMTFTLLPSISILLGVVALSGTLGVPFSWLRLSCRKHRSAPHNHKYSKLSPSPQSHMDPIDIVLQFRDLVAQSLIFRFQKFVVPQHRFLRPQGQKCLRQPCFHVPIPPLPVCAGWLRRNNECRPWRGHSL